MSTMFGSTCACEECNGRKDQPFKKFAIGLSTRPSVPSNKVLRQLGKLTFRKEGIEGGCIEMAVVVELRSQ